MALKNLRFSWKIGLIVATLVVGMAGSLVFALQTWHREMLDYRRTQVKQVVETAHGVIAYYVAEAKAGRMSEDEAKRMARQAVKAARYGGAEYFWINDLGSRMVMHPIKPELDGQDLTAFKDPDGKALFVEMADTVRAKGEGFVDYRWPKPGFDQPVPKVSFVKGVPEWGWLIGSGLYLDDVNAAFAQQLYYQLAGSGVILLVILGIASLIGRDMAGAVRTITSGMERLVQGDVSAPKVVDERRDEFGDMMRAVAVFRENAVAIRRLEQEQAESHQRAETERRETLIRLASDLENGVSGAVSAVNEAAGSLRGAATVLSESADQAAASGMAVAEAARQASANVDAVAAAAEELSASIDEIDRRVSQSSMVATEAVDAVRRTDTVVQGLADGAKRIGQIVGLINEIAAQTNLLALNATIEAARAGDAGKGFAVVAGEVKHLANQTAKATDEISSQIGAIQSTSGEAVTAIRGIGATIEKMSEISLEISASVRQQGSATKEIARNVGDAATSTQGMSGDLDTVNRTVSDSGAAARDVLSAADRLAEDSDALRTGLSKFLNAVRAM